VFVHHSDTGRLAHCHHVRDFNQVPFVEVSRAHTAAVYDARPTLEIVSRNPDRDVIASAGKVALLGFTIADQVQSQRLKKQS
jgi:hypothetical protein